jgi:two-component system, sensor histidine kinase LadS
MKKIIYSFLICLLCANSFAQVYTITSSKEPVRISTSFEYFEDKSNQLSFDQVRGRMDFKKIPDEVPNFNVTTATIWGRIKLTTKETKDWYLSLDPTSYLRVYFWQKKGNEGWKSFVTGNDEKDISRPIPVNHFLVPLNVQAGDTTILYFKLEEFYPIQLDFRVGELHTFISPIHKTDLYNGICIGIMVMMMIYNLYLFFTNRDRVYIYYVLYVFFNLIFAVLLSGYFLHFPYAIKRLLFIAPTMVPMLFGLFGLLFTIRFLNVGAHSPRLLTFIRIFIVLAVTNGFLSLTPLKHFSMIAIQVMGLFLGILSIASGIRAYQKKIPGAIYYLLGFGAYMLSLIYLVLSTEHIFPINDFTWQVLITGSVVEAIMLSFALGDKFKLLQRDKERAQYESYVALKENERIIREQNTTLELKVRERTNELAEKNKEITDSINYARGIQSGILSSEEELNQHLREHFVLFKPKDIVSGDFYWSTSRNGFFWLAVCDSTGHGVPGAFMSLLNINFLNEAINEKNIEWPDEVLNHVRKCLIENTSKSGSQDGMDGILLRIPNDKSTEATEIFYAAANNSPLVINEEGFVAAGSDKMPVGKGEKDLPFTRRKIALKKTETLYLHTDGFADQFGGPKGKKFKQKHLNEKLFALSKLGFKDQQAQLESTLENWKGNLEQVDDVCVVGVRI